MHHTHMVQKRRKTYLREWRKMKPGRTLEQVAAELHITQPQLGRIERGEQPYNQDLLEALAEIYGCEPDELIWRDPTKAGLVVDMVKRLDQERQNQIAAFIRALDETARDGTRG
ncbi:helix-turn-helix domain-containing protein [Novosphingobium sp. NBM11]|uniref:helix-turn-helix domain-containing protein n=1 Tax=Novosphingobium sp. NBM11 TaxID=2596914 RepID=UPI0018927A3F|nr:helix-turn-helix transcriptional regulator [Novosphingobium sp. NBM11]